MLFVYKNLEIKASARDIPCVSTAVIDKKNRMTLPDSVCSAAGLKPNDQIEWRVEEGEIRGRKLVPQKSKDGFPRGSLVKYLTPKRDKEQLAILTACVKGPTDSR